MCSRCGTELNANDKFCPQCGTAVEDTASDRPAEQLQSVPKEEKDIVYRKTCPECHAIVDDKATHCPQCGFVFETDSSLPAENSIKCPSCGAMIPEMVRVCPECGCRLEPFNARHSKGTGTTSAALPPHDKELTKNKSRHHKHLIIVLFIILIVFLIFLYWTSHRKTQPDEYGPEPTEQVDTSHSTESMGGKTPSEDSQDANSTEENGEDTSGDSTAGTTGGEQ